MSSPPAEAPDYERIVAALGSADTAEATNACGILCTLSVASQCIRTAVSSSPSIIAHIESALRGHSNLSTNALQHNVALLVSILSTVASFRRAFVKSAGLRLLVDMLNKSDDSGEQCNVLYALVTLAGSGQDCHSELYDLLVESGVAWKARPLMLSADSNVQSNARTLAAELRIMPQALGLERMGSSDAVHALALLSCDTRPECQEMITPSAKTSPLKHWDSSSRSISSKRKKTRTVTPWKRKLDIPRSSGAPKGGGLFALATATREAAMQAVG